MVRRYRNMQAREKIETIMAQNRNRNDVIHKIQNQTCTKVCDVELRPTIVGIPIQDKTNKRVKKKKYFITFFIENKTIMRF